METQAVDARSAASCSDGTSSALHEVASESQLGQNGRLLVQAGGGRYIALIAHRGDVHAIDATCYHMGGPLLHAEIEDCGPFGPCVVCPWHRYQISLRSGDSLYQNMSGTVCSKGLKQRVHEVVRRDGKILVRIAHSDKIESDNYAFKTPPPSSGGLAAPPQRRSGEVLRAGAAGVRRPARLTAGAAGDVAKSMCGADGRAPWARPSMPPPPPSAGSRLGAAITAGVPAAGGAAGAASAGSTSTPPPLLAGWSRHAVRSRAEVGRGSVRLTLQGPLPGSTRALEWTCGSHALVRLEGGEGGEQPYTPYQRAGGAFEGTFELVVKAYPQGALSPRIAALHPGDSLLVRGPVGGAARLAPAVHAVGFVAGGTGITPMLQVIYSLVRSRSALPRLRLLCFNRRAEDILVADELAELSAAHPEQLRVFHSLSDPPAAWSGGRGRPSKEMLQARLPPPAPHVRVLWCGPPAFNSTVRELLGELGYADGMLHEFS
mmetsp:Transcript_14957/g.48033  ORF Transcript_14957/g.48033 Transcript_14957/m.48033 type:complete len:489 (+) Transcript_14957:195-1661(+)